jgi:hypothetical protein
MDLLTVISACSVARDFTLVLAMATTFSQGNAFAVKDDVELENPPLYDPVYDPEMGSDSDQSVPRSRDAALAKVKRLRAAGRTPLVGILPVPLSWVEGFRRRPAELLDPCINVSVGSAMVAQFEYECGRKGGRRCVLESYARAGGFERFAEHVLEEIEANDYPDGADVVVESDVVFSNPIYPTRSEDRNWGADQIFFTTRSRPGAKHD